MFIASAWSEIKYIATKGLFHHSRNIFLNFSILSLCQSRFNFDTLKLVFMKQIIFSYFCSLVQENILSLISKNRFFGNWINGNIQRTEILFISDLHIFMISLI